MSLKIINITDKKGIVCKIFAPTFKEISQIERYKDKFIFEVFDVEDVETMELVDKHKLKHVPTILIFDKNNNLIETFIGCACKSELIEFLDKKIEEES